MSGRPCRICGDSKSAKIVTKMIADGASDQAIAKRLGGGIHRMAIARHRRNHVELPARALVEAAAKGRDVVEERSQVLAAAEAGDPTAFLALAAIVADLRKVHERLERTADAAERGEQPLAVAALSGQQLRAAEVRARMGGTGTYGPTRAVADGVGGGSRFSINIIFPNARKTESFTTLTDGEPFDITPDDVSQ